jgi:hypothetical protein
MRTPRIAATRPGLGLCTPIVAAAAATAHAELPAEPARDFKKPGESGLTTGREHITLTAGHKSMVGPGLATERVLYRGHKDLGAEPEATIGIKPHMLCGGGRPFEGARL